MLRERIKCIVFERGFLLTFTIAALCMMLFFGKLLKNPNTVYFGATDDGLQAYYGAIYHVKYDSTYWHMNAMNYPYGEEVFFSGCQPFITNPIKLISTVVDISDYTVGILNLVMLFSILFSTLCLYLIFKHLKLPYIYSSIAAVAIALLSPQIIRLQWHYSLTYQFAIPLFLLLLFKFQESPSIKKSILISFLVFFMAGTHFYFFGFFALIALFYWSVTFFSKKINRENLKFVGLHSFIQIGLPFLLFQIIIFLIDNVHDRTNNPWGFYTYTSNLAGVFFPIVQPYIPLLKTFIQPEYPYTPEGYSYVGIVAFAVTIIIVLLFFKKIIFFQFKKLFNIVSNKMLNTFFWAALAALMLSFGYPFKIKGYENLLQYAGLLRQMRGVARFAWGFYYVINIISIYIIFQWLADKGTLIKNSVLSIVLFLICFDAYYAVAGIQNLLNNSIPQLADKKNELPENKWINEITSKDYQAIISLPYFHIGSENIWMADEPEIIGDSFIASLKTGLPITSSILSRTSLSQTFKNIQIALEPYRKLEVVNDFKNKKPFLVLARESQLNEDEARLLKLCTKIKTTPTYNIYKLDVAALENRSDHLFDTAIITMNKSKLYDVEEFKSTDSLKTFVHYGFDDVPNSHSMYGTGSYEGKISEYNLLFNDTIPNGKNEQEYVLSFWMDDFTEDLYPRSTIAILGVDYLTGDYNDKYQFGARDALKLLDGRRALIEKKITIKKKNDKLAIAILNKEILDDSKKIRIDELFIRPVNDTIYRLYKNESVMFNNRRYIAKHYP